MIVTFSDPKPVNLPEAYTAFGYVFGITISARGTVSFGVIGSALGTGLTGSAFGAAF